MGNQMAKEISGTLSNSFDKGHRSNQKSNGKTPIYASANGASAARDEPRRLPKDFVLLEGCSTLEEHEAKIRWVFDTINNEGFQCSSGPLQGEDGLRAIGFEYRFVPCRKCASFFDDGSCCGSSDDYMDERANDSHGDEGTLREEAEKSELEPNLKSQTRAAPAKRISWKPSTSSVSNASTTNSNNAPDATGANSHNDVSTANKRKLRSKITFGGSFFEKSSSCGTDESDAESVHYIPNCTSCHDCVTKLFYIGALYPFGKATSTGVATDANNANSLNDSSSVNTGEMEVTSLNDSVVKTSNSSKGRQLSDQSSPYQRDEQLREWNNQQTSSLPTTPADSTSSALLAQSPQSDALSPIHSANATATATEKSVVMSTRTSAETTKTTSTLTSPSTPPPPIPITNQNRQKYIADGQMYDLLASLAQQATHEYMIRTFHLSWVTICNNPKQCGAAQEPIRALVDEDHRLVYEQGSGKVVMTEKCGKTIRLEAEQEQARNTDNVIMTGREEKKDDFDHETANTNIANINQATTTTTTTTTANHGKILRRKSTFHNRERKGTLLIATGRGKVRAGIFSRQHILTSGIEVGSAWHMIREARMRGMGVVIIDPNARGEGEGMDTFETSVSRLFLEDNNGVCESDGENNASSCSSNTPQSLYILAHSASGGQLVRHLRQDPALLPSIKAIAFTDSTHNVQWCKHDPHLKEMLESKNCVYLRSNEVRSGGSHVRVSSRGKEIGGACAAAAMAASSSSSSLSLTSSLRGEGNNFTASVLHKDPKSAGKPAETDHFWEHRFGKIKTLWAGTAEHSLSNWAGHEQIWDHFDEHATDNDEHDHEDGRDVENDRHGNNLQ